MLVFPRDILAPHASIEYGDLGVHTSMKLPYSNHGRMVVQELEIFLLGQNHRKFCNNFVSAVDKSRCVYRRMVFSTKRV